MIEEMEIKMRNLLQEVGHIALPPGIHNRYLP
jgi:hypothetical protein